MYLFLMIVVIIALPYFISWGMSLEKEPSPRKIGVMSWVLNTSLGLIFVGTMLKSDDNKLFAMGVLLSVFFGVVHAVIDLLWSKNLLNALKRDRMNAIHSLIYAFLATTTLGVMH